MNPFRPSSAAVGYPPLEDLGLIGDGATAALVARDGSIPWLCVPRFDSPPLLCGLLDAERGGRFVVAPEGLVESRQRYEADTAVLVTELRSEQGRIALTDLLTLEAGADLSRERAAGRGELLRIARAIEGPVRVRIQLEPRGGASLERDGKLRCLERPELELSLDCSHELEGLPTTVELAQGEILTLVLRWRPGSGNPAALLEQTLAAWRDWLKAFSYTGPQEELVRRSAITLKLLDHFESGAILAAPTSSLPEEIGGERNWDYRYTWIRDAAFSVYALRRIGLGAEAEGFLRWVLKAVAADGRPRVLYSIDPGATVTEWIDPGLEGYRRSAPVRFGNAAAEQRQHDVFGEIVDCAYQWSAGGGVIGRRLWERLRGLVEAAAVEWDEPDHGIWEVRTTERPFTYSAALCHVALDRGARLSERLGLPGETGFWRRQAAAIRQGILERAWDPELRSLTEHLGGGALDASLLALPLRRVLPATHPRMVATTAAITERLGAGRGLLYRYLPDESPDGLPGHEGAFLLCSFWLVENLAEQNRLDEAGELFDSLCARAGPLGLLPEQIDPRDGSFLGNYPQAFSHIGVISGAYKLARAQERART